MDFQPLLTLPGNRGLFMLLTRRHFVSGTIAIATGLAINQFSAQSQSVKPRESKDYIFICNEDSNTLSVINPLTNQVETTINLTSFDEDPRPPFRFLTGGVMPTQAAMISKPLYHGAIHIHGSAPSPDSRLLAVTGRGTSNLYLIDVETKRVIGNRPNPFRALDKAVNSDWLSSGLLLGREPHEPTFTRNSKELWVALRGENQIAIVEVKAALNALQQGMTMGAVRQYVQTLNGPAQIWFSRDGQTAFVISQKVPMIEVFEVNPDRNGLSRPKLKMRLDNREFDRFGFTPFQKTTPNGQEIWFSHKLADAISVRETVGSYRVLDFLALGDRARPNHLEFVENAHGKVAYVTLARVDDGGAGSVASSRAVIIDRLMPAGKRKIFGSFFTHGREAHGLWTNPENTRLLYKP